MTPFRKQTMKTVLSAAVLALTAGGAALAQAPLAQRTAYPDLTTGEAVYRQVCQGCHMADAMGAAGAGMYPALAGDRKLSAPAFPIMVTVNGLRAMPEFGSSLNDAQIAAVVTYIRTSFGNAYGDGVTPADVAARRKGGQATVVLRAPG